MRQKLNLGVVLAVGVFISYMSLRPVHITELSGPSPNGFFLHALAYFVFTAALMTYFHDSNRGYLEAVIIAVAFGFGIELIQMSLSYRYFGWGDSFANLIGASMIFLDTRLELIPKFVELEDRFIQSASSILF